MAGQLARALADEFPEFIELNALLHLAAETWPRFGVSALDLSQLDDWTLVMLRATMDG